MRIRFIARRMRYVNIPLCLLLLLSGSSLVAQDEHDFDAFMTNTEVLFYEGDYEGAIAELASVTSRTDLTSVQQARAYELLAFCHHSLDDTDATIASLESVFRAQLDYSLRQDWTDLELIARALEARSTVDAELKLQAENNAAMSAQNSAEPAAAAETSEPVSEGAVEPAEAKAKKGGSKRVYYIAGGAVALVGLLILAGGGEKESDGISTVDTLPYPPGRPTGP